MDHTTCKAPQLYEQVYNIQAFTVNTRALFFCPVCAFWLWLENLAGLHRAGGRDVEGLRNSRARWRCWSKLGQHMGSCPHVSVQRCISWMPLLACPAVRADTLAPPVSPLRCSAVGQVVYVVECAPGVPILPGNLEGHAPSWPLIQFVRQNGGPRSVVAAHPICTSKWRATLRRGRSSKLYFKWRATLRRGRVLGATDATAARPSITPFGRGR